jgi:heterodisulfide reductase subunit B
VEKRLLFPGCLVLTHYQSYELAAKAVLERLGIELVDMDDFACCSSSIVPSFSDNWINLAAYNLALAETRGLDIVTLCGSCTRTLKLAKKQLAGDPARLARVNKRLGELGLKYLGRVRISHIIEVLSENLGNIESEAVTKLDLRVALSHPCNVVRPGQVMEFDDPWKPKAMREIISLTGARVVDYDQEYECCGATLLMSSEDAALAAARAKLGSAVAAGADLMVVSCGNCFMVLEGMQTKIRESDPGISLPLMFLPQLLGLSFGIARERLGLK